MAAGAEQLRGGASGEGVAYSGNGLGLGEGTGLWVEMGGS